MVGRQQAEVNTIEADAAMHAVEHQPRQPVQIGVAVQERTDLLQRLELYLRIRDTGGGRLLVDRRGLFLPQVGFHRRDPETSRNLRRFLNVGAHQVGSLGDPGDERAHLL